MRPMTTKTTSLVTAWRRLPRAVTDCVLHHSAFAESRMQAGLALLNPSADFSPVDSPGVPSVDPRHIPLATDILLAAWECNPLDIDFMGQLVALHRQYPFLTPPLQNLFTAALHEGLPPLPQLLAVDMPASDPRTPLQCWYRALDAFDSANYPKALQHLHAAAGCWLGLSELQGHCLVRVGQREEAFALWHKVLVKRPWHVQLLLSLHDYLQGYDLPPAAPADSPVQHCAVLLYSWNKADLLHSTLESLEASLPDISQVVCLNNGSTDGTADCLKAWADRWGARLKVVQLPVNVGAAAARNWLAALPEVQRIPFAAYVDDDVTLPPDWLRHLSRAVQVRPRAHAWGCRILDAAPPDTPAPSPATVRRSIIQSGPLHLTLGFAPAAGEQPLAGQARGPGAETAELAFSPFRAHAEPFSVTTLPPHCADRGQWNFIRACASVTGCCHMFRTTVLQRAGFALSLSPSQYDDVEYDLRALREHSLADASDTDGLACYTGFCAAHHAKKSGQAAAGLSAAAFGNGLGNKYKMHGMFSPADITRMARTECAALEADIVQRLTFIESMF